MLVGCKKNSTELTAKPDRSDIVRAKQRERRIKELMGEVAGHERRAKTRARFNALREKLGINQMPERIVKWLKGRRNTARTCSEPTRWPAAFAKGVKLPSGSNAPEPTCEAWPDGANQITNVNPIPEWV